MYNIVVSGKIAKGVNSYLDYVEWRWVLSDTLCTIFVPLTHEFATFLANSEQSSLQTVKTIIKTCSSGPIALVPEDFEIYHGVIQML